MNTASILQSIKDLKSSTPKRKFSQRYDFVVTLKNFDMKREKLDFFLDLNNTLGKERKVCAFVGGELYDHAKKACDAAVHVDDFMKVADNKNAVKRLAQDNDYFIAQMNVMPKVASAFGKTLGSRGKMPNPKAGCVVPPNANLEQLKEKLQKRVRVQANKTPIIQCVVGTEDQSEEEVADNIVTLYKALLANLPQQENNVKKAYLKFTMSKPVEVK